jgi:photosystem II stability/assembly factor-like uncharacterized protein
MMHRYRTCPSTPTPPRGSRPRRGAALTVIAALALTGCVRASGSQDAGTATGPPHRAIFGPVRAAQLVTATRGWALTLKGLAWTDDGGQAWRDITPPQAPPAGVRGVFFLDGTHGWVVASAGSAAASAVGLSAFRTADAGRTWTAAGVAAPSAADAAAYGGPAWVRFVDGLHGWVLVKDVSSSNFSFGRLYRTTDGGRSWSALEAPLGDPVTFIDQQTGWTAGGPTGDGLFVTRDAGHTWKRQQVQPPSGAAGDRVAYALPVAAGDAVVLPVTLAAADRATIAWYLSRDAGRTWRLVNRFATSDRLSPDVGVPVAAAGDTWVSMLPSSRRLVRLRDDGATIAVQAPATAPAGVEDLQFANETVGWALAASGTCPPGGPCAPGQVLFRTSDGGSSWQEVAVR